LRRENFSIRASNHSGFPDRSSVEAHQLAKLRALLAALLPNNPFCSGKFRAAGFHLNLGRLEEFFERVPFTLKQERVHDLQGAGFTLVCTLLARLG